MKTAQAGRSSQASPGRKPSAEIQGHFAAIKGQRPWRVRVGVGSFLTFEFGPKIRENGHEHGSWHLWVYMSNWTLTRDGRELANSDSDRRAIAAAVRRLEATDFSGVQFDPRTSKTAFRFGDFQLLVTPADYLDSPDEKDQYWLFFMPQQRVVSFGPGGVNVGHSDR
jgi:hypothetical protein